MHQLRGITWDHARGLSPLLATSEDFQKIRKDLTIKWDVRSLKAFGDQPIEDFVHSYDLIMLDHPFIGTGVKKKLIEPLDEYLPEAFFRDQKNNSVGKSYQSYVWNHKHYALPADTAAQVAAYRPDLLEQFGVLLPQTWDEVFALSDALPAHVKIGLPLVPTDAACTFLSLCAQFGGNDFIGDDQAHFDLELAETALAFMERLQAIIHPSSLKMNPIHMLDEMSRSDEWAYIPYVFGYSNYSRNDFEGKSIHFANIPSRTASPSGAIIGGVGIAVSAYSKNKQLAADYIAYVMNGGVQSGRYYTSGGQPGHRQAWVDPKVNQNCHHFFQNTLETLDASFLRPRFPNYNTFQERLGEMIYACIIENGDSKALAKQIVALYHKIQTEG